MSTHEPGDHEVLVNGLRSGGTYADQNLAIEIANRLYESNAPHVATVKRISEKSVIWLAPSRSSAKIKAGC